MEGVFNGQFKCITRPVFFHLRLVDVAYRQPDRVRIRFMEEVQFVHTLTVDERNLAYDVIGQGPPVLCIHGFPLSRRLWFPVAEALKDRYRFILPDLRGMGESQASDEASMATYADDLVAIVDHLGERGTFTIMGLSMGGYVAFEFVRRHSTRIRALILADTRAEADAPEKAKSRLEQAEKVLLEGPDFLIDAMLPQLFSPKAPESLVQEWSAIMRATDPRGIAAALRAMAARPDSTATLAGIYAPTLVIVGQDDVLTPPWAAQLMFEGIAGARMTTIQDAGHMTPVEDPDAFVRAVAEFFEDIRG